MPEYDNAACAWAEILRNARHQGRLLNIQRRTEADILDAALHWDAIRILKTVQRGKKEAEAENDRYRHEKCRYDEEEV